MLIISHNVCSVGVLVENYKVVGCSKSASLRTNKLKYVVQ